MNTWLEELKAATRSLLDSIPDNALDEVRGIWGNTNVAVIKHWKEQVYKALAQLEESQ